MMTVLCACSVATYGHVTIMSSFMIKKLMNNFKYIYLSLKKLVLVLGMTYLPRDLICYTNDIVLQNIHFSRFHDIINLLLKTNFSDDIIWH